MAALIHCTRNQTPIVGKLISGPDEAYIMSATRKSAGTKTTKRSSRVLFDDYLTAQLPLDGILVVVHVDGIVTGTHNV
ncbi:hypothetical protein MRX96_056380 [Rhipicephalus microplus]